jgi:site-specific recombinase XerD
MFDQLFFRSDALTRQFSAPLVDERQQYLAHCAKVRGKGNKLRRCPLWPQTVAELSSLITSRPPTDHLFLNRCGQPITRFGIHTMIKRYAKRTLSDMPSLANKRVSPHTIRHTTATHLLRAGVDINTIPAWVRTRLAQHHKRLCGSGFRNEG